MSDDLRIIVLVESTRQSIARDLGTAAMIAGLWSLGWFAGSSALEWVGVIMGLIATTARAIALVKPWDERRQMTPAQLRAWLDKNYPSEPPQ